MLPDHKTKVVATIGPASDSVETIRQLIRAGMNVARLNFSHSDFSSHAERIERIRAAEKAAGRPVTIMADLPGPKMRLGKIEPGPVHLNAGDTFTLTTRDVVGNAQIASMSFEPLPRVVKPGDRLFLNDGLVQLLVRGVKDATEVECSVAVGGELGSRKGLNLPGINLGISAFTPHDRDCLFFALNHGVDAVSQSFVESAADIEAVRAAARSIGRNPFVIAKIERSSAIEHYDEILAAADGIMVARGDLGVEVPIEQIAITQKELIMRANVAGKPIITATQMLESMVSSRLPTRAEATDVANAVLDGTDCLMLSGESAVGKFPVESVSMLARIAKTAEANRSPAALENLRDMCRLQKPSTSAAAIASVVEHALRTVPAAAVVVPTLSGATARMLSRFKPGAWVVAVTQDSSVAHGLAFSFGVAPVTVQQDPADWGTYAGDWVREAALPGSMAMLVTGPSPRFPKAHHKVEIVRIAE